MMEAQFAALVECDVRERLPLWCTVLQVLPCGDSIVTSLLQEEHTGIIKKCKCFQTIPVQENSVITEGKLHSLAKNLEDFRRLYPYAGVSGYVCFEDNAGSITYFELELVKRKQYMSRSMNLYGPSWERNCELLAKALQSLDRKTATIRRSTNKVISIKDINKEREKVKQATSTANSSDVQVIQDQLRQVERLIKLDPNLNMGGIKLTNEAKITLNAYQSACDNFYKKCINVEETSREKRSSKTLSSLHDRNYGEEGDSAIPLLKDGSATTARMAFEDNLHQEIMAEKARETQEIADSVKDIHEIFLHINEMVEEQGGQLESVNANVSVAERATFNANQNLRRAQQYQEKSYTSKLLLIFVIIMFIITFIALILS